MSRERASVKGNAVNEFVSGNQVIDVCCVPLFDRLGASSALLKSARKWKSTASTKTPNQWHLFPKTVHGVALRIAFCSRVDLRLLMGDAE